MWKLALSLLFFLHAAALLPLDLHNPSNPFASREAARQSLAFGIFALLPPQAVYAQEDFDDAGGDDFDTDDGEGGFDFDFDDDNEDFTGDFAENDDSETDNERFPGGDDNEIDSVTAGRDGFPRREDDAGSRRDGDDDDDFAPGEAGDDDNDRDDFAADDDGDSDDLALDDAADSDDFDRDDGAELGDEVEDDFGSAFDIDSDDDNDNGSEEVIAEDDASDDDGVDDDLITSGGEDGNDPEEPAATLAEPAAEETFITPEDTAFAIPLANPLRLDNIAEDPDGDPHISGEILILVDAAEYAEIISKLPYRIIAERRIKTLGQVMARLQAPTRDFQAAARLISANAPGAVIDYNHTYDLSNAGAALEATANIRRDSRIALNGARVRIGMIDSGVDRFHPSLKQADLIIRDFSPQNTRKSFSHGTAIASLIVGDEANRFTGLIPEATLYAASVFGVSGQGRVRSTTEDLIRAIDWLTANSVPVISMSFAGPKNILLEKIIKTASGKGFTFIAAVGNDGPNAEPRFPSAYASVVAVTAVDDNRRIYRRAVTGSHVEFSAPGVRVLAANDKNYAYANFTGSSFAAPYVAALIAARMPAHDPANKAGVIDFYRKTATDLGQEGRDNIFGFGLIKY